MKEKYRLSWFALILMVLIISTACGLIGNISELAEQADGAQGTLQALVTDTGNLTTQAVEFATEASESGLIETAQAMVTQVNTDEILSTLEAVGTQFPDTAQNLQETAMAVPGQLNTGDVPEDIPLLEPDEGFFFSNDSFLTYYANVEFDTTLSFYEQEMILNGWEAGEGIVRAGSSAILPYTMGNRNARVVLTKNPAGENTLVVITITQQE